MANKTILNKDFAKNDALFIQCCRLANITPSRRQASKFRNKTGIAYAFRAKAIHAMKGE